jgi:hypothetical protein
MFVCFTSGLHLLLFMDEYRRKKMEGWLTIKTKISVDEESIVRVYLKMINGLCLLVSSTVVVVELSRVG